MSNEPIRPIEQNYIPLEELFPNAVIGGVEVNDSISSPTKTWSSEKINTELEDLSDEIDNIDLSGYQVTSAKDTAGGYLGLDSNAKFDLGDYNSESFYHYNSLLTLKDRGSTFGTSETFYGVAGGTSSLAMTTVNLDSGATKTIIRPKLTIGANTGANSSSYFIYNVGAIKLGSTSSIDIRMTWTGENNTQSNDSSIFIGYHTGGYQNTTGNGGTGILFKRNPTVNSGNWQVLKIISGTPTVLASTSVSYSNYSKPKFRIIYDKSTEIVYFYIDNVLVHTENAVNLPQGTYNPYACLSQGASTDPLAKSYALLNIGIKYVD